MEEVTVAGRAIVLDGLPANEEPNWLFATLTYFGQITIILLIFHQPTETLTVLQDSA